MKEEFNLSEKREDVNDYACECPPEQHYLYEEEEPSSKVKNTSEVNK